MGKFGYHVNILCNKTTVGSQATRIGDALFYNAALTYQFYDSHAMHDHQHGSETSGLKWNLSIELNGETRRKNKVSGQSEENSGGATVFLSPGIRVSSGKFSGFLSYGIPVIEDHNGTQTEIGSRIVAGVSLVL